MSHAHLRCGESLPLPLLLLPLPLLLLLLLLLLRPQLPSQVSSKSRCLFMLRLLPPIVYMYISILYMVTYSLGMYHAGYSLLRYSLLAGIFASAPSLLCTEPLHLSAPICTFAFYICMHIFTFHLHLPLPRRSWTAA